MSDTFAKIPHWLLSRTDLSASAKLVYAAIVDRMGRNGSAWPGMRRIADDCGIGAGTAWQAICALNDAELLIVEKGAPRRTNSYRIVERSETERSESERSAQNSNGERSETERSARFSTHNQTNRTRPNNQTKETRPKATWSFVLSCVTDSDFKGDDFREAWQAWEAHRREIRKPLTESAVRQQVKDLEKVGLRKAIDAINASIRNGWTGIFPEKQNGYRGGNRPAVDCRNNEVVVVKEFVA